MNRVHIKLPIKTIISLYKKGWSAIKIGKKFSCCEATIRRRMEKIGIQRRRNFSGANSPKWKKDAFYYLKGYKYIKAPIDHPHKIHRAGKNRNGWYIAEHRLVVEKQIGRYLLPEEIIHHINGIPGDNRYKNLLLCSSCKDHFSNHKEIFEKQKILFKGKHFSPSTEFKKRT
jgi:hypothetical protein